MTSKNVSFVHLHFHTEYSLLDGACQVERVMHVAHELGMRAVAITDHGTLYGLVDFYKTAKSKGIKPILGCEAYVAAGNMRDRKTNDGKSYSNHLVLLAETNEGYRNLCRLSSLAHLEGFYYKPRIDKELLRSISKGLIGLSSCLKGEIASLCVGNNLDAAVRAANEYSEIFGKNNFYLELQDHGIPDQRIANRGILEVAKRTGLPHRRDQRRALPEGGACGGPRGPALPADADGDERPEADALFVRPVLHEERRGDAGAFSRSPEGALEHRRDRGAL